MSTEAQIDNIRSVIQHQQRKLVDLQEHVTINDTLIAQWARIIRDSQEWNSPARDDAERLARVSQRLDYKCMQTLILENHQIGLEAISRITIIDTLERVAVLIQSVI